MSKYVVCLWEVEMKTNKNRPAAQKHANAAHITENDDLKFVEEENEDKNLYALIFSVARLEENRKGEILGK